MSATTVEQLKSGLPWNWDVVAGTDMAEKLHRRLLLELAPGHELYGVPLETVARSGASDDVLYASPDMSRFVIVHLTWKNEPEEPPFPEVFYNGNLAGALAWAEHQA